MNALQFARLLSDLRADLRSAAYDDDDYHDYDWPSKAAAASYLRLLDRLAEIDGKASEAIVAATADALGVYADVSRQVRLEQQQDREQARERAEALRRREEAQYAEELRRHEVAITAECPYCGAAPGLVCRTAGPSGMRQAKGVHDHADRYRAAVGLLGPPEEVR